MSKLRCSYDTGGWILFLNCEWYPVKDKKPEDVLDYHNKRCLKVIVAYKRKNGWNITTMERRDVSPKYLVNASPEWIWGRGEPDYWMPLPTPPRKEFKND